MKFNDSRDDFMMIRDSSFKNICFHKTMLDISKQKIDTT